ncbi:hypothetical protein C9374_011670 [Naegleria lovaniensis]|uniref:Guanylate cyclase domain-containing protein n=1 Tax=Naegleria lovaniensis TaxID=51637 RepID=A0AA88GEJ4_NAELO|nr:uncharacterized protein C9374_011670 [Naegleria lovaniensis]KAG2374005.1 hypothetical protein C9374_011670 [Naegleria lovaniensis]
MVKVQPTSGHEKTLESNKQLGELFSNSDGDSNSDESLLEGHKKGRPFFLRALLSVRLFLIVVITIVVVLTALSIWITAFTVNEQTALEQVNVIIANMNEKISGFLQSQLLPAKQVAQLITDDYHNFKIDHDPTIRNYLFSKVKLFGVTNTNLVFGENGNNQMFAYSVNADSSLVWGVKLQQSTRFIISKANNETGEIYYDQIVSNISYVISATDYYKESIRIVQDYPTGGYGAPYKVLGGPQSTFFSVPVFNRTELLNGIKNRVGFAKINISLATIAQFLKSIKVLTRGYVIISEFGNNFVIGSNLAIDGIDATRVKATDIKTRDAGSVMTNLLQQTKDSLDPVILNIASNGTNYLVSSTPFVYTNLKWRMTLVFEENEIKKGIIMSSYVILGVTLGVTTLGILISVVIGWIVTNPFINLQEDFKKIEVLDLVNIKERSAFFSEAKSIYSSLTETVRWLSEFRAFLPDSVLNQLEHSKAQQQQVQQESSNKKEDMKQQQIQGSFRSKESSSHGMDHSTSGMGSNRQTSANMKADSKSLFKLGLSSKDLVTLVHISIPNLSEKSYPFDALNNITSKCLTSVSSICKTCRADLQIKSYDEYVVIFNDKSPCITALETCLKLKIALESLNNHLNKEGLSPLQVCMGVSSGECLVGNIGNKQMRYFEQIGEIVQTAKNLSVLANFVNVQILLDARTFQMTKDSFVFRPVERIMNSSKRCIDTVYQLVQKNQVADDEWMYELETKQHHAKFQQFANNFCKLFDEAQLPQDEINDVKKFISNLHEMSPEDLVLQRLNKLIELNSTQLNQLSSYYTNVSTNVTSYVQGEVAKLDC